MDCELERHEVLARNTALARLEMEGLNQSEAARRLPSASAAAVAARDDGAVAVVFAAEAAEHARQAGAA